MERGIKERRGCSFSWGAFWPVGSKGPRPSPRAWQAAKVRQPWRPWRRNDSLSRDCAIREPYFVREGGSDDWPPRGEWGTDFGGYRAGSSSGWDVKWRSTTFSHTLHRAKVLRGERP